MSTDQILQLNCENMTTVWYWTDGEEDSDGFPSLREAVNSVVKAIVNDDAPPDLDVYSMARISEAAPISSIESYTRPVFVLKVTVDDINADGSLKRKLTDEGWQD